MLGAAIGAIPCSARRHMDEHLGSLSATSGAADEFLQRFRRQARPLFVVGQGSVKTGNVRSF